MSNVTTSPNFSNVPTVNATSTAQQLAVNTKYYASNASTRVVFTLPATANTGDLVQIRGNALAGWRIAQNSGQAIHGSTDTTRGSSGYLESQTGDDCTALECLPGGGTDWKVINTRGTLTYG